MKIEADDSIATMESIFSATARLNKIKNIRRGEKRRKSVGKIESERDNLHFPQEI